MRGAISLRGFRLSDSITTRLALQMMGVPVVMPKPVCPEPKPPEAYLDMAIKANAYHDEGAYIEREPKKPKRAKHGQRWWP